jgi:hypothetical protein
VNEPSIFVFLGKCRVSIAGVRELTIPPLRWLSFRAGDDFTAHFSKKDGRFVTARNASLSLLASTPGRTGVCTTGWMPRYAVLQTPTTDQHIESPI